MVKRIFRETEQRLQAVTDCPALEAALLIEACLGISREKIWAGADCQVDSVQIDRLEKMLWKRLQGYPLQYLLGEWEFYSLPFTVGEGVLIPRADTERLVDCALQFLQNRTMPRVLDLCSGSGCIAIAIAHEHPDCTVTAVELDEQAMEYLRTNIVRHHVPVCAVQADVLKRTAKFG